MREDTRRLDAELVARALAGSREKAQKMISAGLVTVNGAPAQKPSLRVSPEDVLNVTGALCPYVSRGGLKLEKALRAFDIRPEGLVCVDVGASTGGFTDVLLQNGAARVYAIDVGAGQLDPAIAGDPRVVSMEHTNARALTADLFDPLPTLAVMDVSFISIRLILPAVLPLLGAQGRMVSLIKPQFEAGRQHIGKRGIVSRAEVHRDVLEQLCRFVPTLGWGVRALDYSPISGGDGNLEFLADLMPLERCGAPIDRCTIADLVARAHKAMKV